MFILAHKYFGGAGAITIASLRNFIYILNFERKVAWHCISVIAIVIAILLTPSLICAQEWLLSGSWTQGRWHRHEIISSEGEGIAQPKAASPVITNFGTNTITFGFAINSGRFDLVFRRTNRGHYRLVFDSAGSGIRLEEVSPEGTAISHAESTIPHLKPDTWYNVQVLQSVTSDEEPAVLHVKCEIDGKTVLTSSILSPLPVGEISFTSYQTTKVLIDVDEDDLDREAQQLQMQPYSTGRHEAKHFITLNRNTFAQKYSSLGRPPALVEILEHFPIGYVIEGAYLKEQGYVLPDVITSYRLQQAVPASSAPVDYYDLESPNFPLPSVEFITFPQRPIIHAITPYELNVHNDPANSIFEIYGTNLGTDYAVVYLGNPMHEATLRRSFPVQTLDGEEARRAPGNDEGLETFQKIHVDLRNMVFAQNLMNLHQEGEVYLRVYPDYKGPNFSNRAQIFLKSRWPAETMFVAHTTRFRIRNDNTDVLDGTPEEYWALGGSTIDSMTLQNRLTTVHFPVENWAPWAAGKDDWLVEIPVFAAKVTDTSQLLSLGVTGFETDSGAGDSVVKVMEALGKGLQKIKTSNPIADAIMGGAGGILEGVSQPLRSSDSTFGVLALRFLESDNYGEFVNPGLRELTLSGETKALAELAVKKVEAPYLHSATVRVKRFRWTTEPFDPNAAIFPPRDNDMYVVARAATSFDGTLLGRSGEPGLHTGQFTRNVNEWVELSPSEGIVLQEYFDPPQPRPFLYLEFAVWDYDETNDDDNFGGPVGIMLFFDEQFMYPHKETITNYDIIRLHSYTEGISCEIEYEYEIRKSTSLPPSP